MTCLSMPPTNFLQPKYCLKIIRSKTVLKSVGAIERNQKAKLHRDSMENCHFWHWNSRYSSRIPVVNIPRLNIFEWTLSIISKSLLRLCAMKTWNCFFCDKFRSSRIPYVWKIYQKQSILNRKYFVIYEIYVKNWIRAI